MWVANAHDRNDRSRDDAVADATIGWAESECDWMYWMQTNSLSAIDTGGIGSTAIDATGCYQSALVNVITGCTGCKRIGFGECDHGMHWVQTNRLWSIDTGGIGSTVCDRCHWVLSIGLLLAIIAVGANDHLVVCF
jgi:hypothetical protein